MHNLECGTTIFRFNSDMSGDVLMKEADGGEVSFKLPGHELLAFLAEVLRRQAEAIAEQSI